MDSEYFIHFSFGVSLVTDISNFFLFIFLLLTHLNRSDTQNLESIKFINIVQNIKINIYLRAPTPRISGFGQPSMNISSTSAVLIPPRTKANFRLATGLNFLLVTVQPPMSVPTEPVTA